MSAVTTPAPLLSLMLFPVVTAHSCIDHALCFCLVCDNTCSACIISATLTVPSGQTEKVRGVLTWTDMVSFVSSSFVILPGAATLAMSNPSKSHRPLTPSKEAHIAIDHELNEPITKEVSATAHAVHSDSDVEGLANVQRIRRLSDFSKLFWFSLTFMSTWVGMNTSVFLRTVPTQANRNSNMFFALYNGGPQTFAWSIVIVYFGAVSQAASIAEMASIRPNRWRAGE